jgi:hypothetical protein
MIGCYTNAANPRVGAGFYRLDDSWKKVARKKAGKMVEKIRREKMARKIRREK